MCLGILGVNMEMEMDGNFVILCKIFDEYMWVLMFNGGGILILTNANIEIKYEIEI